jgi:hypothetical protein
MTMIRKKEPSDSRCFILPITFWAYLEVEAADKKSAAKTLNVLFRRYYFGVTEDGKVDFNVFDMSKFHFCDYSLKQVVEV